MTRTKEPEDAPGAVSRRGLLKGVGVAGAAAATTGAAVPLARPTAAVAQETAAPRIARLEAREVLTAAELDTLEAMVARIIPTDENGPGAAEARAAYYIDRGLGGALAPSRDAYSNGLAAIDAYAESSRGAPFASLSTADQDAVLTDMETNAATGFVPSAQSFFNLVRTHTIQGTFCDPYHGGNADFVGWDLIAYPGIRTVVTEDDQRMSVQPAPVRMSAYEDEMFAGKGNGHGHHP